MTTPHAPLSTTATTPAVAAYPRVVHVVDGAHSHRAVVTALGPAQSSVEVFAGDTLLERRHHHDLDRAMSAASALASYHSKLPRSA